MSARAHKRERDNYIRKLDKQKDSFVNLCNPNFMIKTVRRNGPGHRRCYASVLGGCSDKISKEHFISRSILKKLGVLSAQDFPWLMGRVSGKITADHLVANCLCEYHNTFLSPLDAAAGEVFENFSILSDPKSPCIVIWGPTLERWFLKLLIGLVAAKVLKFGKQSISNDDVPIDWIEILFGVRAMGIAHGMFILSPIGNTLEIGRTFGFSTLFLNKKLLGIKVRLGGIWFYLSMVEKSEAFKINHPNYNYIIHRMSGFHIGRRINRVKIFWDYGENILGI